LPQINRPSPAKPSPQQSSHPLKKKSGGNLPQVVSATKDADKNLSRKPGKESTTEATGLSNATAGTETSVTAELMSESVPEPEPEIEPTNGDGVVTIRFNHYKKQFPIEKGSLTSSIIDAEYYVTFAYPGGKIHLSKYGPSDYSYEELGLSSPPLEKEQPEGTYHGLEVDKEYFVVVEEDQKEKEEYEARQAARIAENTKKRAEQEAAEAEGGDLLVIRKEKVESCSCIEGNPCIDPYCCKDFPNRYEVAKRNGWKGFQ
jgi:hypothetical protein